jgi:hypothetical protein
MAKSSRNDRRARVEAMRREQRRKERRSSFLVYGLGSFLAVAVLLAAIIPSVLQSRERSEKRSVGYVTSPSAAATAANCTGVRNDAEVSRDHVTTTVDYAKLLGDKGQQIPPSSGPHDANPLPDAIRFYNRADKPKLERAVHNLEHGFVVAWYDPELPQPEVDKLQQVAQQAGERFIAVPWDRGVFPDGRHFVLTAWDRTQRCATVNTDVVADFLRTYADPTEGQDWDSPTAAETGGAGGTLTPDGTTGMLPPGTAAVPGAPGAPGAPTAPGAPAGSAAPRTPTAPTAPAPTP